MQLYLEKGLQDIPRSYMHIMPVQQQSNATDCGVFPISNAFQLFGENNVPSVVCYGEEKGAKSSDVACFEKQSIAPFPKYLPSLMAESDL